MTAQKPDEMLIYLSYPIMDIDSEPKYLDNMVTSTPDHWVFYRPIFPTYEQTHIHNRLDYLIPETAQKKFAQTKQTHPLMISVHTVLDITKECEVVPPPNSGILLMLRDLAILSISDLVVSFCDEPCFGGRGIELLWANILGIPTVGVADRFVHSPWLQSYTDAMVTKLAIYEELLLRGAVIDSTRKTLEKPERTNEEQKTT